MQTFRDRRYLPFDSLLWLGSLKVCMGAPLIREPEADPSFAEVWKGFGPLDHSK